MASTRRSTTRRPRLPAGAAVAIVRAYMAHHQGMTAGRARQCAARRTDAARGSTPSPSSRPPSCSCRSACPGTWRWRDRGPRRCGRPAHVREFVEPSFRQFTSPHDPTPRTHLLSNGRYTVMLTTAGSGYSRCAELAVTRWREDVTRDHWGTLPLPAGCPERRGLVGRVSAHRRRAGRVSRDLLRGPRRAVSARRRHRDHARGAGLARGRRRAAPGLGHEPRRRGRARSS